MKRGFLGVIQLLKHLPLQIKDTWMEYVNSSTIPISNQVPHPLQPDEQIAKKVKTDEEQVACGSV
jgi:hypothetical protein